jgi:hypothetical protein
VSYQAIRPTGFDVFIDYVSDGAAPVILAEVSAGALIRTDSVPEWNAEDGRHRAAPTDDFCRPRRSLRTFDIFTQDEIDRFDQAFH